MLNVHVENQKIKETEKMGALKNPRLHFLLPYLSDKNLYQEVQFKEQMLSNLVDTSNKFLRVLKRRGL